jgi:hypothetical protein
VLNIQLFTPVAAFTMTPSCRTPSLFDSAHIGNMFNATSIKSLTLSDLSARLNLVKRQGLFNSSHRIYFLRSLPMKLSSPFSFPAQNIPRRDSLPVKPTTDAPRQHTYPDAKFSFITLYSRQLYLRV